MGEDYEAGISELKALDRTQLSRADQSLLLAVLHVASHLRDPPSDAEFAEADREVKIAIARSPTPVEPNPKDPVGITIRRTEAALQNSDELLRQSGKNSMSAPAITSALLSQGQGSAEPPAATHGALAVFDTIFRAILKGVDSEDAGSPVATRNYGASETNRDFRVAAAAGVGGQSKRIEPYRHL